MLRHFDRQGNELTTEQWFEYLMREEDVHGRDFMKIARYRRHDVKVSTIWLMVPIEYPHRNDSWTAFFETMIFIGGRRRDKPSSPNLYQTRYPTEAEALRGHERIVSRLKARGFTAFQGPKWTEVMLMAFLASHSIGSDLREIFEEERRRKRRFTMYAHRKGRR
jgi:hypothetical protein